MQSRRSGGFWRPGAFIATPSGMMGKVATPRGPSVAQLSQSVAILALAGTPLAACGARSGLPVDGDSADELLIGDASCLGTEIPIVPDVPNLYFVLDVSRSMANDAKWTNVRSVVSDLVTGLAENASFGVTVFPAPGGSVCSTGVEVMPLQRGDALGQAASAFRAATNLTPSGGTPTAATFAALTSQLTSLGGVTFAILATDGGPNCDSALPPCDTDQCTSNIDGTTAQCYPGSPSCCGTGNSLGCLDGDATNAAIGNLHAMGIPTYVLGIPGSAPYGPILDALAVAGGTARATEPYYYRVDTSDTAALKTAFEAVAADAMKSCTIHLKRPPADPDKVNVSVSGTVVPSAGGDGWGLQGSTVTLAGTACGLIQGAAAQPKVRIIEGCPTIR